MTSPRRFRSGDVPADAGGAIVEFIGMSLLLLVPVVYLIVALSQIQAATFAVELSAREAARSATVAGVAALEDGAKPRDARGVASRRAEAATDLTLEDFGFTEPKARSIELTCSKRPCFQPGTDVYATVEVRVALPGVPSGLASWMPLGVTVSASAVSAVEDYGTDR